MIARIRRWLARPPEDAPPSETLRWVRRLVLAMAAVLFVSAVPRLLLRDDMAWVIAGAGLLMLASAALLTVSIRAARRRERR